MYDAIHTPTLTFHADRLREADRARAVRRAMVPRDRAPRPSATSRWSLRRWIVGRSISPTT